MREALTAFLSDLSHAALFESLRSAAFIFLLALGAGALGLLVVPVSSARPALRALAGVPLFVIFGGAVAIMLYLLGVPVRTSVQVLVAGGVALVVLVLWRRRWRDLADRREVALLAALLTVGYLLAFFGWGETADGTIRAILGAWGDGPLHVLNAEAFVRREGADIGFPAFAGEVFREPVGYDFVAAMLRSAGLSVGAAFSLPAAALLACLLGWMGHLAAEAVRQEESARERFQRACRPVAAGLAVLLLLTFGGLQWAFMAQLTGAWTPARFFGLHDRSWDHADELGLAWAHHVKIFSSQKHFLLALAFLVILASVLQRVVGDRRVPGDGGRRLLLGVLAGATGLLPLFHAHTFLAAAGLWAFTLLAVRRKALLRCVIFSLLLAAPILLWYAFAVSREGFARWAPGYLARAGAGAWWWFWLINLGIYPLLVIPALRLRSLGRLRWLLALPAGALFVLGNLFQLQPYLWDNHKLFFLAWVLVLPLAVTTLVRFVARAQKGRRSFWRVALVGGAVVSMTLTTLADLPTLLKNRAAYPLYTAADRQEARRLDVALPLSAVVLADTRTRHNHPLTLTGRTLVLGYEGWLWTRGYTGREERARLLPLFLAGERRKYCQVAGRLGVTHVVEASGGVVWPASSC